MNMKIIALVFVLLGVAAAQNCSSSQFECDNGRCVPGAFLCDKDDDCRDGSDEPPKLDPNLCPACGPTQFRCDLGYCIASFYVCDMDNNCMDGSDERGCPDCPADRFQCEIGGCIPEDQKCDGKNNCLDWSDESEAECPCSDDEVRCATSGEPGTGQPGACIPADWVCDADGIWDCPGGSDQQNCDDTRPLKRPRARPAILKDDFSKIAYRHRLSAKHASKKH